MSPSRPSSAAVSPSRTTADDDKPTRRRTASEAPSGDSPPPKKRARARLTEEQKKHNHIESEQKRRGAIRIEFDTLAEIVPGMAGQGRSEATVMHASVGHIRHLLVERSQLVKMARQRGFDVSKWDFAGLDILVARARRPLDAVLEDQPTETLIRRRVGRGRQSGPSTTETESKGKNNPKGSPESSQDAEPQQRLDTEDPGEDVESRDLES